MLIRAVEGKTGLLLTIISNLNSTAQLCSLTKLTSLWSLYFLICKIISLSQRKTDSTKAVVKQSAQGVTMFIKESRPG